MVYGPFYRYKSPTQTDEITELQIVTRELHGKASRNFKPSNIPKVKAYSRPPTQANAAGIEFTTNIAPDTNTPPGQVFWSNGRSGVERCRGGDGETYVKIRVVEIKQFETVRDPSTGNIVLRYP